MLKQTFQDKDIYNVIEKFSIQKQLTLLSLPLSITQTHKESIHARENENGN